MVENIPGFDVYSREKMGQSLGNGWLSKPHPDIAPGQYQKFLEEGEPYLFVLPGSDSSEAARERAEGLVSNLSYFDEEYDRMDSVILTPEEELEWTEDILEEAAYQTRSDIILSEDVLDRGLETSIDDVIAAQGATSSGDRIIYHTDPAHARALTAAAEEVHGGERDHSVLSFGNSSLYEHLKQEVNSVLQRKYHSRKRDF